MSEAPVGNPGLPVPQKGPQKSLEEVMREKAPDILNTIPRDKKPRLAQIMVEQRIRSGPLPAPEELAAYSQIIPNGADRIMKMAEEQATHRIALEKKVVGSQQTQAFCGQIFGLVVGLTGLGLATYAAVHGQPWFGSVIGGTTLVSLVSVFVYSQRRQKAELTQKRQQMEGTQNSKRRK